MPEQNRPTEAAPLTDNAKRAILVEAGLFSRDPSTYPGLSMRMDPAEGLDQAFRPVAYDTRHTTGRMVHCSICPQRQEHFDGAIVQLRNGSVGLVGNDCGKRHFFGEGGWTAITNRLQRDSEQALFLARFGPARERVEAIDGILKEWTNQLRIVHEFGRHFQGQLPDLFVAIRRAARDESLHLDEEMQVPIRMKDGGIEMRTVIQPVPVCRLEPIWFFNREDLSYNVQQVRLQLNRAAGFLHSNAKPHNILAVKQLVRDCRKRLEDIAGQQRQLKSLATEKSVGQLAYWGNAVLGEKNTYLANGKKLTAALGDMKHGEVDFGSIPNDLQAHMEAVQAMWPSI